MSITRALGPALVLAVAPLAGAADLPAGLDGRFAFSEKASERAALEQAIEATAKELSFMVRPVARSRLRGNNRIAPSVELRTRGDQLTVHFQGRSPMTAGKGGEPATWKNEEGNAVTLQYRIEGTTLVQVLKTPEGSRTNRFSPGPDGGLKLAVEMASPKLPRPLKYELTYNRIK